MRGFGMRAGREHHLTAWHRTITAAGPCRATYAMPSTASTALQLGTNLSQVCRTADPVTLISRVETIKHHLNPPRQRSDGIRQGADAVPGTIAGRLGRLPPWLCAQPTSAWWQGSSGTTAPPPAVPGLSSANGAHPE
jgi:hypothetical protein